MNPIKLTLYLGQEKGFRALQFLQSRNDVRIIRVFVSRDNKVASDYSFEIEEYCQSFGIPLGSVHDEIDSDFAIAIGYRKLINWPDKKLIVLHDSLLPKYRGFAPLISMLENGEKTIGVSAFLAEPKYDAGQVLARSSSRIRYPIKISQALSINHKNYEICLTAVISKLQKSEGYLSGVVQNHRLATFSLWRDESDYQIDWNADSKKIARFVDAVGDPYDGAKTYLGSKLIRVTEAVSVGRANVENPTPGKVVWMSTQASPEDRRPTVVCGSGLLRIDEAHDVETGESIFPLKSVRIRFGISS